MAEGPTEGRPQRGRPRRRQQQQPQEPIMPKVYRQVNGWSEYIQRVCTELYIPGSCLTVDECMVRFTGRSVDTTTLPTKPIPTGYKVWVLAQDGYFLRWLWHTHNKGAVGIAPSARAMPQPGKGILPVTEVIPITSLRLNPTQGVVVTLLNLLQNGIYHIFLDNLFPTPNLFKFLRQ